MKDSAMEEKIKKYAKRYVDGQAVTILPVIGGKTAVINRQYRKTAGSWMYELPSGKMEPNENPRKAAIRELEEETGYNAGSLRLLFSAYLVSGINTKKSYFYLATNLKKGTPRRESGELIETRVVPLGRLYGMVKKGMIADSKSVSCILYYKSFVKGKSSRSA
ncbi:MAG: NUDIX hydrolase [Candidatus Micrarchaeales archaeon]|jgi:ADP-ribose pyrophosphatase|uniref:NUDIX hydrolase n=1 Tax=Candidatus Micrarchaeum acidiphilum ARMAN-2 TaxID=425595 RepID=C7DGR1_MICA2|nr:MAG: NUDIX hydrolase [Candidatus Micrarchaeum acidiphilum ARMAN-2]MCW6161540.1 NUDIX hydrolase [Candidatus Micrarchaeales archaeon]